MNKIDVDIICGKYAEIVSPVIDRINRRKKTLLAKQSGLRSEDISSFLKSPYILRKILENIQQVPEWKRKSGNNAGH